MGTPLRILARKLSSRCPAEPLSMRTFCTLGATAASAPSGVERDGVSRLPPLAPIIRCSTLSRKYLMSSEFSVAISGRRPSGNRWWPGSVPANGDATSRRFGRPRSPSDAAASRHETAEQTNKNPPQGFPVEDENACRASGSPHRLLALRHAFSDRQRATHPPHHCFARANAAQELRRLKAAALAQSRAIPSGFFFVSRASIRRQRPGRGGLSWRCRMSAAHEE